MKTIAYWMGIPLSELSREELELAFIQVNQELERERKARRDTSISEIRALAALRREQLRPVFGFKL